MLPPPELLLLLSLLTLLLLPPCEVGAVPVKVEDVPKAKSSPLRRPVVRKPRPTKPPARPKDDTVRFLGEEFALGDRSYNEFPVWHAPFPTVGQPWPKVQSIKTSERYFRLNLKNLQVRLVGITNDILKNAVSRYAELLVDTRAVSAVPAHLGMQHAMKVSLLAAGSLHDVRVKVMHSGRYWPHLRMDESYRLQVGPTGVFIWSSETWGCLRGLETLAHLVWRTTPVSLYINETEILDRPQFPHRGFLLDSSRHYMSLKTILTNLDAMAANKLNVLHWHMTDDQSFPFKSEVFPSLSLKGAYHPRDMVYTAADIKEIVNYARMRGIRVVPEFDSPAHSYSWGKAFPQLLTECFSGSTSNGYYGPLNPARNSTFAFLAKLYSEIISLFPDEYLHLGIDEVPTPCWSSNEEIQGLMRRLKLSDVKQVTKYYVEKLEETLDAVEKRLHRPRKHIMWQEGARTGAKLLRGTVVQVWYGNIKDVESQAVSGQDVLFSNCWYLDTMKHWSQGYLCDLGNNQPWKKRMLGGDACMWAEKVSDSSMLQKAWPAASAAAERLWSESSDDLNYAGQRLEEQRCRMLMRGIPVGVASGPGGCPATTKLLDGSSRVASVNDNADVPSNVLPQHSYRVQIESLFFFISTVSCLILLAILVRSLGPHVPALMKWKWTGDRFQLAKIVAVVGFIVVSGLVVSMQLQGYTSPPLQDTLGQ